MSSWPFGRVTRTDRFPFFRSQAVFQRTESRQTDRFLRSCFPLQRSVPNATCRSTGLRGTRLLLLTIGYTVYLRFHGTIGLRRGRMLTDPSRESAGRIDRGCNEAVSFVHDGNRLSGQTAIDFSRRLLPIGTESNKLALSQERVLCLRGRKAKTRPRLIAGYSARGGKLIDVALFDRRAESRGRARPAFPESERQTEGFRRGVSFTGRRYPVASRGG